MTAMKKILITLAVVTVLSGGLFLAVAVREYREINAIDKSPVNISDVADGIYEGSFETTLVKARVRVTVNRGRIEGVEILEHQCGKGRPANVIADEMTKENKIDVDAISGATVSSEVIKAAVRDALRNGL